MLLGDFSYNLVSPSGRDLILGGQIFWPKIMPEQALSKQCLWELVCTEARATFPFQKAKKQSKIAIMQSSNNEFPKVQITKDCHFGICELHIILFWGLPQGINKCFDIPSQILNMPNFQKSLDVEVFLQYGKTIKWVFLCYSKLVCPFLIESWFCYWKFSTVYYIGIYILVVKTTS